MAGACPMGAVKRRVDEALQRAVQLLGAERCPEFPAQLPHAYEDKFTLADLATEAAIAGQLNILAALAGGWSEQLPWLTEQAAGRCVTLRFSARESCTLDRQEARVLEDLHRGHREHGFGESVQTALLAFIGREKKVVHEDIWRVSVEWEISAYAGADPADSSAARVLDQGQGWREIRVARDPGAESAAPRPAVTVAEPVEVQLEWLLRRLAEPRSHFRIDRSAASCRTPSRNEDVSAAFQHCAQVQRWSADVRAWLQDALLSGTAMPLESLLRIERVSTPMEFTDSEGDVNRLAMEGLQVVWYEPDSSGGWQRWAYGPFTFDLSTGELRGRLYGRGSGRAILLEADRARLLRCALGGSLSLQEVDNRGGGALPLVLAVFALERRAAQGAAAAPLSAEDLGLLAAEHARSLAAGLEELRQAHPEASGQLPGARLAACLRLLSELVEQYAAAVDAVEGMLRKQLVAALGKEVGPNDFDDLMSWHHQRVLRNHCRPRAFSYPIQQPGMSAEGHLSIEVRPGQELRSFASCRPALQPMSLPINATVSVLFKGNRTLHGALLSYFAEQPEPLKLETRVRHFGCVVLVLGTVASADSFSPTAAMVLRGEEALSIPLLLEALPTAREFRDATASLSPEQRRFAEAVRAMQLASTVFGVCVIPVKPQLERLLGLPKGSLTQEVKLTEDLIELLMKYHVPSSLLRYEGSEDADEEAKLKAVKEDVQGLRSMIEEEKLQLQRQAEQERAHLQRGLLAHDQRGALFGARRAGSRGREVPDELRLRCEALAHINKDLSKSLCLQSCVQSSSTRGYLGSLISSGKALLGSTTRSARYSAGSSRRLLSLNSTGSELEAFVEPVTEAKGRRSAMNEVQNCNQALPTVAAEINDCPPMPSAQPEQHGQPQPAQQQGLQSSEQREQPQSTPLDNSDAATPPPQPEGPPPAAEAAEAAEVLDYTSIPALLDKRCDEMGEGAALRPVTIKAGSEWKRRSKNLVGVLKDSVLGTAQQRDERNSAFDLLDALTCSGALAVEDAELHVLLLMAHCFEEALLDMLVQDNVNPIEPVERSSLILASTVHGCPVAQLLESGELLRVGQHSPALLAPSSVRNEQ